MNARALTLTALLTLGPTSSLASPPDKTATDDRKSYPTTPCSGTLSGAVKGSFTCKADVRPHSGGLHIAFNPDKMPKGVSAFMAGEFQIKGAPVAGTYTLQTLGKAQVRLTTAGHRTFWAVRQDPKMKRTPTGPVPDGETAYQGSVALELKPASTDPHQVGKATGTVTATLVPSDPKDKGEVVMVLKF